VIKLTLKLEYPDANGFPDKRWFRP